jgi:hypothetical protein
MKQLFLIVVLSFVAIAQEIPTKGDISIGGSFLFAKTSYPKTSMSILSFSPEFSYFVNNNLEIGAALSIQSSDFSNSNTTAIGIGPYLAAYFKTQNIKPYIGIVYTYVTSKSTYGGQTFSDNSENSLGLFGGILIPLNQKIAISPLVKYSLYFVKGSQLGDVTQIMFGIGIKAFL